MNNEEFREFEAVRISLRKAVNEWEARFIHKDSYYIKKVPARVKNPRKIDK
jgi:hypothetical protein